MRKGILGSILLHVVACVAGMIWVPRTPPPPDHRSTLAVHVRPRPPKPDPTWRFEDTKLPVTLVEDRAPAPLDNPLEALPPLPRDPDDVPAPDDISFPSPLTPHTLRGLRLPLSRKRSGHRERTAMSSPPVPSTPDRKTRRPLGISRAPLPPPAALRRVDYPRRARSRGWHGSVTLRLHIGTDGTVLEARIHVSSGHGSLDRAAQDAVGFWTFQPALRDGRPVAAWVRQRIEFSLRRK